MGNGGPIKAQGDVTALSLVVKSIRGAPFPSLIQIL